MEQRELDLHEHPAEQAVTDVIDKLRGTLYYFDSSLTKRSGVLCKNVYPLGQMPLLKLNETEMPVMFVTLGTDVTGKSDSTYYDVTTTFQYMTIYSVLKIPTEATGFVDIIGTQKKWHWMLFLNLRSNAVPIDSTDTNPSAFGMPFRRGSDAFSSGFTWFFGGADWSCEENYDAKLPNYEIDSSMYKVSSIKLPLYTDIRKPIA